MEIIRQITTNIIPSVQKTDHIIGVDLLGNLDQIIQLRDYEFSRFLILSDAHVFKLYGQIVVKALKKLGKPITISTIAAGENSKKIERVKQIVKPYFHNGLDRSSCLVSLGGGVVTDLGGFIASILLRGIPNINIPTTLLGQVDAAIGGKTGVDYWFSKMKMCKNMIGTFNQPNLVISDIETLKTLPEDEILNGLGEIIKYWIGWGSPSLRQLKLGANTFLKSKKNSKSSKTPPRWPASNCVAVSGTPRMVKELVKTISICQKIKIAIVQKDPFDQLGIRQKLNLGHTIGHALEGATNGMLSHGQAVAIGLAATARISLWKNLLKEKTYHLIINTIQEIGLPTNTSKEIGSLLQANLFRTLRSDKKGGNFVLIKDIGKLKIGIPVEEEIINKIVSYLTE
ncbi:3-dehydroquinate synthase [Candidatus Gottesmanbacteria bacterium]|nr:3-dehydroquinate synthase [Candidatus Gottesmanbacteria bacterium]